MGTMVSSDVPRTSSSRMPLKIAYQVVVDPPVVGRVVVDGLGYTYIYCDFSTFLSNFSSEKR